MPTKLNGNVIHINGQDILPGKRITLDLPFANFYTHAPVSMPVQVVNGRKPGPRLFVSAAIHGDELNGVEIIRRLLKLKKLEHLRGTLIAVPVVNIFGLIHHSRYLPDRRDLNRSFPGSDCGSLAARLAHLFMTEIVAHCTHGIDLHTGAYHRVNLPQVRAHLDDPETARLARAFGVPVMLNSVLRDASLREAAAARGIPMLLYEAGEALRFDEDSINVGLKGVVSVMHALEMLPPRPPPTSTPSESFVAYSNGWIRAPHSGILRNLIALGKRVSKGDVLGIIADPFGEEEILVRATSAGMIIGRTNLPLVNEGEALFHIARFAGSREATAQLDAFREEQRHQPLVEGDPPPI